VKFLRGVDYEIASRKPAGKEPVKFWVKLKCSPA
jgi:hypothetical protein